MNKLVIKIIIIIALVLMSSTIVRASEEIIDEEYIEEVLREQQVNIEFDKIQEIINLSTPENTFDLNEFFAGLLHEDFNINIKEIVLSVVNVALLDLKIHAVYIMKILLIIIFAAIYNNLSATFNNKQIIKISNLIITISISSIMLNSYNIAHSIAYDVVTKFDEFIHALIPSMMAVSVMSGSLVAGNIFTQAILMLSALINSFIKDVLLPYLYIVLVFVIVNTLSDKGSFKKMIDLLKKVYYFSLKGIIFIFLGIYSLQSIGLPTVDTLATKTAKQTISVLPVVGSTLSEVSEIVLACGNMTKNIFGIGVIIGGVLIALYPVVKLLIIGLVYKGLAAIVEPIVQGKISNCISDVGDICFMLFGAVAFVVSLFIISVTLCIYISNIKNYMM